MPPPCWKYGVMTLGKNAAIFFCIGRDEESIPGSSYTSRGRQSVSHSSLALRDKVILLKSIFASFLLRYIKYFAAFLGINVIVHCTCTLLQLPWSILDFGGMEVRRPVIVTIPRGSNFKWHGEAPDFSSGSILNSS